MKPRPLPDRQDGDVFAFAHDSLKSAEAAAKVNRDEYGHRAWVEFDGEWISYVDVGPAVAALRADYDRNMAAN